MSTKIHSRYRLTPVGNVADGIDREVTPVTSTSQYAERYPWACFPMTKSVLPQPTWLRTASPWTLHDLLRRTKLPLLVRNIGCAKKRFSWPRRQCRRFSRRFDLVATWVTMAKYFCLRAMRLSPWTKEFQTQKSPQPFTGCGLTILPWTHILFIKSNLSVALLLPSRLKQNPLFPPLGSKRSSGLVRRTRNLFARKKSRS